MAKLKVSLSIGFPSAVRRGVIEIDDDEISSCETEYEKNELFHEYWEGWASSYIEADYELVDE